MLKCISMLYIILVLLLMNIVNTNVESDRRVSNSLHKIQRKRSIAALVFTTNNNYSPSSDNSCQWLSRLKRQRKMCGKRRGLPETLLKAKILAVTSCETQFQFSQWNCSRRDFFFKKLYRETAFMHSIASSAIMYSIARACTDRTLSGCTCGGPGKEVENSNWHWGGCGDNTRVAKKFMKRFFQLKKTGDKTTDLNFIIKHNTEIGIKVVMANEVTECRCHGVTGSCTVKTCWRRIRPFEIIAKKLKMLYHNAIHLQYMNDGKTLTRSITGRNLFYLESDHNFCGETVNRRCNNTENCATLCCGKGFYSSSEKVLERCNCGIQSNYSVNCEKCIKEKTIFRCK